MKTWQGVSVGSLAVLTAAFFLGTNFTLRAQMNFNTGPFPQYSILQNPVVACNPAALELITNLLTGPAPELSVPEVSQAGSPPGTYWTLSGGAPLPFDPYLELPVYAVSTNHDYLINDLSVDYEALNQLVQVETQLARLTNGTVNTQVFDLSALWLEMPTYSLANPGQFRLILHNSIQGQSYDFLTKTDLLYPVWSTELTVTGTAGNETEVELPMNGRTNLFVRARISPIYSFYFVTPPLSQEVAYIDTVTFSVKTGGNTNLTYQWFFNGEPIAGATNRSYTIDCVRPDDRGSYSVMISDGIQSVISPGAYLQVDTPYRLMNMPVTGPRQDYTFKSGVTYYIGSLIQLYGRTTIEAGAVLKFDWYSPSGLQVKGTLVCKGGPYNPAILTSVDDDSAGEPSDYGGGFPETMFTGLPYLDLTYAQSDSISNLRFCYADWGVTTPAASGRLDVWDCQFVGCNYGVVNLVDGTGAVDSLHNVLFASCGAAIGAVSNSIAIEAEQVTADVGDFYLAWVRPNRLALTNSIITGTEFELAGASCNNVAFNPDQTNFQSSGLANYYLAANSPLHVKGTPNISSRLQSELRQKTTDAPIALAAYTQISGDLTLSPQATRYSGGTPDLGYHYDALDYTVAVLWLSGGKINVLPGTAIAVRNDYIPADYNYTYTGFYLAQGASLVSHGTPTQPSTFTTARLVQETPDTWFSIYQKYDHSWFSVILFTADFEPGDSTAPTLDFRFSNLYLPFEDYHLWSGCDDYYSFDPIYPHYWMSSGSAMYLSLQDCHVCGGRINLGKVADTNLNATGAVLLKNSLFENVNISIDPDWPDFGYPAASVDLSLQAYNNLFKGGKWLHLEPIAASAGHWIFKDNLFDHVNLVQDINQPLDYDNNGYWPLTSAELAFDSWFWTTPNTNRLQVPAVSNGFIDGQNEVVLSQSPPYQTGPFGNFYLPNTTSLYGAGSRTAGAAELAQYTTSTNQTKEGAAHTVNIGLHYVSTQPSTLNPQPLDSDNDGVPDYLEDANGNGQVEANETDLSNSMTDNVTPDALNSAYDDIDLSGDGLVGRIKKTLGLNPLDPSNPLTLTQVAGSNQNMVTFEIPISYDVLTNIGGLNLNIDGIDATLEGFYRATNGHTLFNWNSTYDTPGQHYLQPQLTVKYTGNDIAVLTAVGPIKPFYSANLLQFFESGQVFDANGARFQAHLTQMNANFTIQIYDPSTTPPTLINTIAGSTTDGMIMEGWGLTNLNGFPFTSNTFTALYNVTIPVGNGSADSAARNNFSKSGGAIAAADSNKGGSSAGTYAQTQILGHTVQGNGFDFAYVYTPPFPLFYDFMGIFSGNPGAFWLGMQNVVDTLLMPQTSGGGGPNNYVSGFNYYTGEGNNTLGYGLDNGYPGYINDNGSLNRLLRDMTNSTTQVKNLFMFAHGGRYDLQSADGVSVDISTDDVSSRLGNLRDENGNWKSLNNPYRFVFLYACSSATWGNWRRAFGIMPIKGAEASESFSHGLEPQAFVGWGEKVQAGTAPIWNHNIFEAIYYVPGSNVDIDKTEENAWCFTQTLKNFYYEWMQGTTPLAQCIYDAAHPGNGNYPFPLPGISTYTLSAINSPLGPFNFTTTHTYNAPIIVAGHSGLTRAGVNREFDRLYQGVQ